MPVTNAQFAAFLNEHAGLSATYGPLVDLERGGARIVKIGARFVALSGYEEYPVIVETWQGARAYCAARGARLPTEAEWERAARGTEGRAYPWGDEPPDASRARYAYRLYEYLPVGSYPTGATPDGILDMAGNVPQWTSTRYAPYPYRADDGREDPDDSGERVTRGGGASTPAEGIRATYRNVGMFQTPPAGRPPVTFRCARDAE
jgi:iron(II)-dependent oxidoreductase